jgi:hypothetical protein
MTPIHLRILAPLLLAGLPAVAAPNAVSGKVVSAKIVTSIRKRKTGESGTADPMPERAVGELDIRFCRARNRRERQGSVLSGHLRRQING